MKKIFISYAEEDKSVAEQVCHAIEAKNISCWIAPRDIGGGDLWDIAVSKAISEAHSIVVIVSSDTKNSRNVLREIDRADNRNKTLIPFKIDASKLSESLQYRLGIFHIMDASTPPLEKHIEALVKNIRKDLGDEATVERALEGILVEVIDINDHSRTTILPTSHAWRIHVEWRISELERKKLRGSWLVSGYLEAIGPGYEGQVGESKSLDLNIGTSLEEGSVNYFTDIEIAPRTISPGVYRLVITLTHKNDEGLPSPIAGISDEMILQLVEK